jgi:large subunit ribosomal protein L32
MTSTASGFFNKIFPEWPERHQFAPAAKQFCKTNFEKSVCKPALRRAACGAGAVLTVMWPCLLGQWRVHWGNEIVIMSTMAVPKKKTSPSRRGMRRAHKHASYDALVSCEHCNELRRSHHVCLHCGHYKGRHVMQTRQQQRQKRAAMAESVG